MDHQSKTFEFSHAGKTFDLPRFKHLKAGVIRKTRHLDEADVIFTVIESVANPTALAAIDDMTMDELMAMQKAWLEDSGVSLGESSNSSS